MTTVKSMDVRDNFKHFCDVAFGGEVIVVSRRKNENVVIMSEKEYHEMAELVKAKRNSDYMAMLDQSMKEAASGGFTMKTIEELEAYET